MEDLDHCTLPIPVFKEGHNGTPSVRLERGGWDRTVVL